MTSIFCRLWLRKFSLSPGTKDELLRSKIIELSSDNSNVSSTILNQIDRQLLHLQGHPLNLLSNKIKKYFSKPRALFLDPYIVESKLLNNRPLLDLSHEMLRFSVFDSISPIVSTWENFDSLNIPPDHPARSSLDTYYINTDTVLRTHMTTHEKFYLSMVPPELPHGFILLGDVYRRDEIDNLHYPIFHQLEVVRRFGYKETEIFHKFTESISLSTTQELYDTLQLDPKVTPMASALAILDLKTELVGLIRTILGPDIKYRWVPAEFPFTSPSFELEIVTSNGVSVELLGCGLLTSTFVKTKNGLVTAWAAGLGIERLAMLLYGIPDIRLFWTEDERFLSQFQTASSENYIKFHPYSKHPPIVRDIAFWLPRNSPEDLFHINNISEIVRSHAGPIVEKFSIIDKYNDGSRTSHCYRIQFRSFERYIFTIIFSSLSNGEVNDIVNNIKQELFSRLQVTLR